jgi:hypothetical protein
MAGRAAELATRAGRLRLAATPFVNRWNGQARLELSLKDFALEP